MDECELIALVTAAACGISKCCSEDDISLMSVVFSQLGDTLATVLTFRELNENNSSKSVENNENMNNNIGNNSSRNSNNQEIITPTVPTE